MERYGGLYRRLAAELNDEGDWTLVLGYGVRRAEGEAIIGLSRSSVCIRAGKNLGF